MQKQNEQTQEQENARRTFCSLTKETKNGIYAQETYKHFILEWRDGELIIYNFNHKSMNLNLKLYIFSRFPLLWSGNLQDMEHL